MLSAEERRAELVHYLQKNKKPLSGAELGKIFGVSRQIIVGDMGILRASGLKITSTARGYLLDAHLEGDGALEIFECSCKTEKDIEKIFTAVVEYEGVVRDIFIKHPAYGEIRQQVMISSAAEIEKHFRLIEEANCKSLPFLTNGKFFCAVKSNTEEAMESIKKSLKKLI